MRLGDLAADAGRGMAAGVVGTAAITAFMTLEGKLRGKPEPTAAGEAVERLLDVKPAGEDELLRLSRIVHWMYGTAWGAVRGLLGEARVPDPWATALHYGAISGTAMVMPPALGVMPPPRELPAAEIAASAVHHLVYAVAVTAAWRALTAGASDGQRRAR